MHFKVFWTIQKEDQIRYGLYKAVNFKINLLKKWSKGNNIEIFKPIMKESLLLLKDLLEL